MTMFLSGIRHFAVDESLEACDDASVEHGLVLYWQACSHRCRRWKVGRSIVWLQNYRRLVTRYEYHADLFQGLVQLAATLWINMTAFVLDVMNRH